MVGLIRFVLKVWICGLHQCNFALKLRVNLERMHNAGSGRKPDAQ